MPPRMPRAHRGGAARAFAAYRVDDDVLPRPSHDWRLCSTPGKPPIVDPMVQTRQSPPRARRLSLGGFSLFFLFLFPSLLCKASGFATPTHPAPSRNGPVAGGVRPVNRQPPYSSLLCLSHGMRSPARCDTLLLRACGQPTAPCGGTPLPPRSSLQFDDSPTRLDRPRTRGIVASRRSCPSSPFPGHPHAPLGFFLGRQRPSACLAIHHPHL